MTILPPLKSYFAGYTWTLVQSHLDFQKKYINSQVSCNKADMQITNYQAYNVC